MKTVCKKLLCLMLVAMMLVSAVPFAFATEGETETGLYWIEIRVDGEGKASKQFTMPVNPTANDVVAYAMDDAEFGAYFAQYDDYEVGEPGAVGCAINFIGAAEEPEEPTEEPTEKQPIDTITFYYLDSKGNETSAVRYVYEDGATITPPAVPANPKAGFSYWAENANGGGDTINPDESLVYNSQTPNAFHAIYNKKSAMSELKIYVVRYVNGVRKEAHYLFSEHFTTSNDNNMYQYLWSNKDAIRTAAIDELGEGYTWNNKFYNYFTDEELTDANLKDNGDKSVYIKMNTKNSNEAQVLIYVHKKVSSAVYDILEMDGYNAGEWVYLKDVKNFLDDEGYSWSSTSSLYTDEQWDDLLDGESPSGANGIKITDNGTYKIHIVLNGVSNSKADSSNPKTGDNIMIAVTTMTLAAAALVAVVELKKRKMI